MVFKDDGRTIPEAFRWTVEVVDVERTSEGAVVDVALRFPPIVSGDDVTIVVQIHVAWPAGQELADVEAEALSRLYNAHGFLTLILGRMIAVRAWHGGGGDGSEV